MNELQIELSESGSETDVRRGLSLHILHPTEAAIRSGPTLYGSVDDPDAVWLGVTTPGRSRFAQRFFRGRLVRHGDTWSLVGKMAMPPNGVLRLLMLAALGGSTLSVGIKGVVANSGPAWLPLAFAVAGLGSVGAAALLHLSSVSRARADLDRIRASIGRSREATAAMKR
jgi:hypothetical protein